MKKAVANGSHEIAKGELHRRCRIFGATIVLLLLAGTGRALAQTPAMSSLPTETDLHAAFCTQALKTLIAEGESSMRFFSGPEYSTVPNPNDPPELRASKEKAEASNKEMKATLESERAMLRKIDLYLKPRILNLDPVPLLAAQRAAQEDWERIQSAVSNCQNKCPMSLSADAATKCNNDCATQTMPDFPTVQHKMKSCLNLEWLPF